MKVNFSVYNPGVNMLVFNILPELIFLLFFFFFLYLCARSSVLAIGDKNKGIKKFMLGSLLKLCLLGVLNTISQLAISSFMQMAKREMYDTSGLMVGLTLEFHQATQKICFNFERRYVEHNDCLFVHILTNTFYSAFRNNIYI